MPCNCKLHIQLVGLLFAALAACSKVQCTRSLKATHSTFTLRHEAASPDGYVAMCLIARDSLALRDWLEHYLDLGVSKVYLYDHNSSTPLIKQLWDYVEEETVVYHYVQDFDIFQGDSIVQFEAYRQCIKKYAHRHQFLAFLDDDEYIVLKPAAKTHSLPLFLQAYEGYGGLAVNWQVISSSGHVKRPRGKVTDNYVACLPQQHYENTHVKVIANTKHVISTDGNPHTFKYLAGAKTVNENLQVVPSAWADPVSIEKIVLYHYTIKSQQDFQRKVAWSTGAGGGLRRSQEWFDSINADANETCTLLQNRRHTFMSVHAKLGHDNSSVA